MLQRRKAKLQLILSLFKAQMMLITSERNSVTLLATSSLIPSRKGNVWQV